MVKGNLVVPALELLIAVIAAIVLDGLRVRRVDKLRQLVGVEDDVIVHLLTVQHAVLVGHRVYMGADDALVGTQLFQQLKATLVRLFGRDIQALREGLNHVIAGDIARANLQHTQRLSGRLELLGYMVRVAVIPGHIGALVCLGLGRIADIRNHIVHVVGFFYRVLLHGVRPGVNHPADAAVLVYGKRCDLCIIPHIVCAVFQALRASDGPQFDYHVRPSFLATVRTVLAASRRASATTFSAD